MKNRRNYYRLLQVQPDAPFEVIRSSYRTLMRELKNHPDLGGSNVNAVLLNEAYSVLSDELKRKEYDRELRSRYLKEHPPEKNRSSTDEINVFCDFCKRPLEREPRQGETCPTCRSPLTAVRSEGLKHGYKRSVERIKKWGKIQYYRSWPQKGESAEMIDVSPHGIRFRSDKRLTIGSVVKISSPFLKAIAKVINARKKAIDGSIYYIIGASFITVDFASHKGSFLSARA